MTKLVAFGWGLGLAMAYVPQVMSAPFAPKWGVAAIAAGALFSVRIRPTLVHWLGALWLGFASVSLLWTSSVPDGLFELGQWTIVASLFVVGAELDGEVVGAAVRGFALGMVVNAILAAAQVCGFDEVRQIVAPAGLFGNKNYLAEAGLLAICALLAIRERWWYWFVGPAIALVLGAERSSFMVLAVVLAMWTRVELGWSWRLASQVAFLVVAGAAMVVFSLAPSDSIWASLGERQLIYAGALQGIVASHGLGWGLGSYFVEAPRFAHFVLSRPEHAHDDYLEMAFELGIIGPLPLVAATAVICWRNCIAALPLVAFGLLALVEFPLHFPASAALVALLAGRALRESAGVHGLLARRRRNGRRGAGAIAWASRRLFSPVGESEPVVSVGFGSPAESGGSGAGASRGLATGSGVEVRELGA